MGQSVTLMLPGSWNLARLAGCLSASGEAHGASLETFENQVQVSTPEGTWVVIRCVPDRDPDDSYDNKADYVLDPDLDEDCRSHLDALHLFDMRFNELDFARRILRCIAGEAMDALQPAW